MWGREERGKVGRGRKGEKTEKKEMSRRDEGKKREGEGREKRCMLSRHCKLMQIPHLFVSLTDLTQTEVDCPGAANTSLCPCFICTAKYPKLAIFKGKKFILVLGPGG